MLTGGYVTRSHEPYSLAVVKRTQDWWIFAFIPMVNPSPSNAMP